MAKARLTGIPVEDLLDELVRRFCQEQVDARKASLAECQKVELPDWFKPAEWHRLQGDAGQANNDHFQVYVQMEKAKRARGVDAQQVHIKIFCPQFLRGPLTMTVEDGDVWGSY
jgi:hypothetical protein